MPGVTIQPAHPKNEGDHIAHLRKGYIKVEAKTSRCGSKSILHSYIDRLISTPRRRGNEERDMQGVYKITTMNFQYISSIMINKIPVLVLPIYL